MRWRGMGGGEHCGRRRRMIWAFDIKSLLITGPAFRLFEVLEVAVICDGGLGFGVLTLRWLCRAESREENIARASADHDTSELFAEDEENGGIRCANQGLPRARSHRPGPAKCRLHWESIQHISLSAATPGLSPRKEAVARCARTPGGAGIRKRFGEFRDARMNIDLVVRDCNDRSVNT
jgi:hypothetical protein